MAVAPPNMSTRLPSRAAARRRRAASLLVLGLAGAAAGELGCHPDAATPAAEAARGAEPGTGPQVVVRATHLVTRPSRPVSAGGDATLMRVLRRGLTLRVLTRLPGYAQVCLADGAEGFVPADDLMPAAAARAPATVLAEATAYAAPDGGRPRARVPAGALLFVQGRGASHSAVQLPDGSQAYLPTDALAEADADVALSHLIAHADVSGPDEAAGTLAEARIRYPDSPLLEVLAERVPFDRITAEPVLPTMKLARPTELR